MTALPGDARDRLAAALADGHAAYYADPRMVDLKACQLDALLPVVAELADQAAAEELRAAAKDAPGYTVNKHGVVPTRVIEVAWLRARAAALEPTTEGTTR